MPYSVSVRERDKDGTEIVQYKCRTRAKAIKVGKDACLEHAGKSVFVSYWNNRGEDCLLEQSGRLVIVGTDWNKYSN